MSDHQVCQGTVVWPAGGAPSHAQGSYGDMFTFEANGRGLSIAQCADRLLTSLENVSDQNICARSVIWSEWEQVPYWSSNGGIYHHVAQSRGFEPLDCHDSNFECLDHGFDRGTEGFKQCRLQLVVARRENARIQLAIEAAAAEEAARHHRYAHREVRRHDKYQSDNHDRGARPARRRKASMSPPPGTGPVSKIVADFRPDKSTKTTNVREKARPPAALQAAAEALLRSRAQTP